MGRRWTGALAAMSLLLVACLASPAAGAPVKITPKKPGQVRGAVIDAGTMTTLTLNFPKAARARKYHVSQATNEAMTDAAVVRTVRSAGRVTLTGLQPGRRYCFQVRAQTKKQVVRKHRFRTRSGKKKVRKVKRAIQGKRSPKVCRAPIAAQGAGTGPTYNLATYNMCVLACARGSGGVPWLVRRPKAAELLRGLGPDVIGLQETPTGSGIENHLPGYRRAAAGSGKVLLYRGARFTVATDAAGAPRSGEIALGQRRAVWAELVDAASAGERVVVVNVHLEQGTTLAADRSRAADLTTLLAKVAALNPDDVPVLYLGDFNSHPGRTYDSVTPVMRAAGYTDAYELARQLVRPHHNSGNQGDLVPRTGSIQGYHMDKLWVRAPSSRVLLWRNGARIENGRYVAPLPSNHNPILVRVQLDARP